MASAGVVVLTNLLLLFYFSLISRAEENRGIDVGIGVSNYSFPDDFIFGASTSAYQIEGAWNEGGKGESVWDHYVHLNPHYAIDNSTGDIATDSYYQYKKDVQMLLELGVSYYRLSIAWTRILPNGTDNHINEEGIRYYRNLFKELLKHNIKPFVTLFHWDLPQIFMDLGGWTNPKIVDYFEDYARVAFREFGDLVKDWITMNEPNQHCFHGYGNDYFAPALLSHGVGDYLCSHYILLAHARAYRLYEKEFRDTQKGKVGIALDIFWPEPKNANRVEDREAAERYVQMTLGIYAHPIYSKEGDYPELVRQRVDTMSYNQGFFRSRLPHFTQKEIELILGSSDFFGLNHYTTILCEPSSMEPYWHIPSSEHDIGVKMTQDPSWPKPGAEWLSVYPSGFRKTINWIAKSYGKEWPIIVTENGVSDYGYSGLKDYARVSYYNKYLYQLLLAKYVDGCDVRGYFAWTLMDGYEWRDGYKSKFGLYHVDFNRADRRRTPKLSAVNYREIIRTRRIDFNYITPSLSNSPEQNSL